MAGKPFLVLQVRPETEAADDEYAAMLAKGKLAEDEARRLRLDVDDVPGDLDLRAYAGVIVGGGPGCVSDPPEKKTPVEARMEAAVLALMPRITEGDLPFLGCCYGLGALVQHLGGVVDQSRFAEPVGPAACARTEAGRADPLLRELPNHFGIFVGHKEAVQSLPPDCVHLLEGDACPVQMVRYRENVYATQFHPEADPEVFALRIRVYRDAGYFAPEEADALAAACRVADVHVPERILEGFVRRYRGSGPS
ncbi:MAG: glutamine amidotransferase [Myxococcota bacterium]